VYIQESNPTSFQQWRKPERDYQYVIGADVAEGLEHGDYSCLQVVCLQTNEQVAEWHAHIDADLFGEEIAKVAWYYNRALIAVEVNNHGLTTNKALQRLNYPKLYIRHELDGKTVYQNRQTKIGWLTTKASKPLMIDELSMALRQGLVVNDKNTIGELLTYTRNEKGQMGGSPFDDRVIALAIANQMLKFATAPEYKAPEDKYWTFDYFKDKAISEASGKKALVMGSANIR